MSICYDFHLHSCLSPCGDDEMTPFNLVNMAALLGYDAIALTDHNSALNCPSALKAGEKAGITVIPGMELCTCEEIHTVCLFETLEGAMEFSHYVHTTLPPIENRPDIFGNQIVTDSQDNPLSRENLLLTTASSISIGEVSDSVKEYGGICYPAHIDRASYSIISALGDFPSEYGFKFAEITEKGDKNEFREKYSALKNAEFIVSSDSHYLENMPDPKHKLPCGNSVREIIEYLRGR